MAEGSLTQHILLNKTLPQICRDFISGGYPYAMETQEHITDAALRQMRKGSCRLTLLDVGLAGSGSFNGALPVQRRDVYLLYWALALLLVAVVTEIFGFSGLTGQPLGTFKILFFIFFILFVLSLDLGLNGRRTSALSLH